MPGRYGKPEELFAKTSDNMDNYSEFLTIVDNDPVKYYYNGRWVRSLYDENKQNGNWVLLFYAVEDKDALGKTAINLKTIRSKDTNKIEKLVMILENSLILNMRMFLPKIRRRRPPCLLYTLPSTGKSRGRMPGSIAWAPGLRKGRRATDER